MRKAQIKVISVIAVLLLIAFLGTVYADTGVPAVPEIQGLSTGTSSNVQGTVTEADSGAWTTTNDPDMITMVVPSGTFGETITPLALQQLLAAGGSVTFFPPPFSDEVQTLTIPVSLLNQMYDSSITWAQYVNVNNPHNTYLLDAGGIHTGMLDPGQVQYTTGYNAQYSGISGQQTFAKSMAISTANTIADQSNIKANTNVQFIAIDTGRATNSEDLLLDGAAQAQNSASLILCPFANANPGIIPAFCNIEQAGSAFDTTLTSTVTSADTRFVGTDATIPTVLNYNINAQGITLSDGTSSPMIGSVSAYLKVHVQEARNESTITIVLPPDDIGPSVITFPDSLNPKKSEDLVYSETSTASGLISKFSKSMSYSSQASAVPQPPTILPVVG
jgi:hypothetical protein